MSTFLKMSGICHGIKFAGGILSDCLVKVHTAGFIGGVGRLQFLLIRIFLVAVSDLGGGGAAGYIGTAAFRTDVRVDGHIAGNYFAVIFCRFLISVADVLLLVASDSRPRRFRIYVRCRLEGDVALVGTVLIFAVLTGLALRG